MSHAITYRHLAKRPDGTTVIAGRRIRVDMVDAWVESGDTPKRIAKGYELPLASVYEALAYAADHPEEMQTIRDEEAAIERDLLSRLPPELTRGIDIP